MVTAQAAEGNIAHTAITSYSYGTLRLKKGPNLPGPIFPTLPIISYNFLLNNYSLRDSLYICPRFLFLRPHFVTPIRDPISRLPFATHICDSYSRLIFAPHVHQSWGHGHRVGRGLEPRWGHQRW